MNILIILPTLRERSNLERLIPDILRVRPDASVLVVDDQSRDGTKELVDQFRARGLDVACMERTGPRGYGKAILDGFRHALAHRFDAVVTMDADYSHEPTYISGLLEGLENHDMVIGSRYVPGGGITNWSYRRRALSRFANGYIRFILRVPFRDGTTGFVAYRRRAVENLVAYGPRSEGYSFLVECKYHVVRAGFAQEERPIIFRDRTLGASKMSWKVIWESIWVPWRLRFQRGSDTIQGHHE